MVDLGVVLGGPNGEKSSKNGNGKHAFFSISVSKRFLSDFCDFGSILGVPGLSKNS